MPAVQPSDHSSVPMSRDRVTQHHPGPSRCVTPHRVKPTRTPAQAVWQRECLRVSRPIASRPVPLPVDPWQPSCRYIAAASPPAHPLRTRRRPPRRSLSSRFPHRLAQRVGAHNSVVGADQGFRAPSGDQESVRDSVHEDSASAPIAAGQRPRPSFRHPQSSRHPPHRRSS